MTVNITSEQLKTVASAYGLNIRDRKVVEELTREFNYAVGKAAAAGDTNLARGEVAALLDSAAQRTATRLGVRQPGGIVQRDTSDPRQRYLNSLPPAQREAAERWQTEKNSPAEQQRQQNMLRQQFLEEVNTRAVDRGRGHQLNDRMAAYLVAEYKKRGLQNVSISREDIGQDDLALYENLAEKPAVQSGAYRPMFKFNGEDIEAADRPHDSREQGYQMPGTNGGR